MSRLPDVCWLRAHRFLPPPATPAPTPLQLVDRHQDLVRVRRLASFNSIDIQASAGGLAAHHHHVLSEEESPLAGGGPGAGLSWPGLAADTAPLKGGDGYDRLLEYRCGRYLFHHGQQTFLPVPAVPPDFGPSLAAVAGSRNVKGARCAVGGLWEGGWRW